MVSLVTDPTPPLPEFREGINYKRYLALLSFFGEGWG